VLENEGFPVIVAGTVERAVKDFSEFRVSGIITEYWIDNRSTLEAIRKLKEIFPETYVMMITDSETKPDEYKAIIESGVDDYFLKPVSIYKILLHLKKGLKYQSVILEKNKLEKELSLLNLQQKGSGVQQGERVSKLRA
jgi:DNA-binding response OmpR family regulator